jgi:hypothetical protein
VRATAFIPTESRPTVTQPLGRARRSCVSRFTAALWAVSRRRHLRGPKEYGLHFSGVTSSAFPLRELIQPAAVRLHGQLIGYGLPRPSVTCSATSSSKGALSIGFQSLSGGRIGHFHSSCGDNIARPVPRGCIMANAAFGAARVPDLNPVRRLPDRRCAEPVRPSLYARRPRNPKQNACQNAG